MFVIRPQLQLVKKTGRAWPICIPAAPNSFTIALIANDQLFQGGVIEMKVASCTQSLNRSNEDQICCSRAETWSRRQNEKFPRLEMRRRLQAVLCKMRTRIHVVLRHLVNWLKV